MIGLREFLRAWVFAPLWDMLYSAVEMFLMNLPRPLGYEGADQYAICGQMLGRGSHEITPSMFDNTCLPMFREKYTSISYTIILVLFILAVYLTYLFFYRFYMKGVENQVALAAIQAGREALVVASRPQRIISVESKEKGNRTKVINAQMKTIVQQLVNYLEQPLLSDELKVRLITSIVRNANPAVRDVITGDLVAAANIQASLLEEAESDGKDD
jgi:hypothetical protein